MHTFGTASWYQIHEIIQIGTLQVYDEKSRNVVAVEPGIYPWCATQYYPSAGERARIQ